MLQGPLRKSYLKACYDRKFRSSDALKNTKVWEVVGDRSYSFAWPTYWEIEKDDKEAGGGEEGRFVRFKVIEGGNHFVSVYMHSVANVLIILRRCTGMNL